MLLAAINTIFPNLYMPWGYNKATAVISVIINIIPNTTQRQEGSV